MTSVLVLVGTATGAFILASDGERREWSRRGPLTDGERPVGYVTRDLADGALYAAGFGPEGVPAVGRSEDLGESWIWSSQGLTAGAGHPEVRQVWTILPTLGGLYAGVDPAGLFRSDDRGRTWRPVGMSLLDHPTANGWRGGKGGLCLHSIVPQSANPDRLWVAIAGGGVMFTEDAGLTWEPRNPPVGDPGGPLGLRVQRLEISAGDEPILYQQNHLGVFRSFDGGKIWEDVTGDLPSRFGFPLALHPREPGTLYVIPHFHGPNRRYIAGERAAIWRGVDGGRRWEKLSAGLPRGPELVEVLRQGLATDSLAPAGVYFGTTDGRLFASADDGNTWSTLASDLPSIYSVTAAIR
jgi:hypothetical protein